MIAVIPIAFEVWRRHHPHKTNREPPTNDRTTFKRDRSTRGILNPDTQRRKKTRT